MSRENGCKDNVGRPQRKVVNYGNTEQHILRHGPCRIGKALRVELSDSVRYAKYKPHNYLADGGLTANRLYKELHG